MLYGVTMLVGSIVEFVLHGSVWAIVMFFAGLWLVYAQLVKKMLTHRLVGIHRALDEADLEIDNVDTYEYVVLER